MEDRRSIAKKAAIGVALVIAAAGAVLFQKKNLSREIKIFIRESGSKRSMLM